jgi:hypothetical protein
MQPLPTPSLHPATTPAQHVLARGACLLRQSSVHVVCPHTPLSFSAAATQDVWGGRSVAGGKTNVSPLTASVMCAAWPQLCVRGVWATQTAMRAKR